MSTADKLNKLLQTKEEIRQAIIDKGVEVTEDTVFADYATKINAIEVGGGADEFLVQRTLGGVDMSYLFYCYPGNTLNVSNLDTSNVRTMKNMFAACIFTELNLSNFNTGNVNYMTNMFSGCMRLEKLNLSNFTAARLNMDYMFSGCDNLREIRLDNCSNDTINKIITSEEFPTEAIDGVQRKIYVNPDNVGELEAPENWVFVDCNTGEEIVPACEHCGDPNCDGSCIYCPDCGNLNEECKCEPKIPEYEVGEFKFNSDMTVANTLVTEKHTDLSSMFNGCTNLAVVNTSKWDTYYVENMSIMFECCQNLPYLDLSSFKTDNVTNMECMFKDCTNLLYLDISNFGTGEKTDDMFNNCASLLDLRLDNCDNKTIDNIINSTNFPTGTIDNVPRVIYIREEYQDGLSAPNNWAFGRIGDPVYIINSDQKYEYIDDREIVNVIVDTQAETDKYEYITLMEMFYNCSRLRLINGIEQWNTSGISDMDYMFSGCTNLVSLNLSSFDTSSIESGIYNMFEGCTNLRYLDISNFVINCNIYDMFTDCNNLRHLRLDNCDYDTIEKIINSEGLPTGYIFGVTRKMYVKEANVEELTAPEGWGFVYVDVK